MATETTRRRENAGADPAPVVTLPAAPAMQPAVTDDGLDEVQELLDNLRLVKLAMEQAAVSDPLKCAQLSKRRSELVVELRTLGAMRSTAATPEKSDPIDSFFGGDNVTGFPTAPSRKSS